MAVTHAQFANGTTISWTTGGDFTALSIQGIGASGESYASETVTPLDGAVARNHEVLISKRATLKPFTVTFFFKGKYPPTFNDDTTTITYPDNMVFICTGGVTDTEFGESGQDGVMLCTAEITPDGQTWTKTGV